MATSHQLQFLRNHPKLQRFLIANARPTGRQLGAGSYGSVEELEVSGVVCAGKKIHEILIEQGNFGTDNIVSRYVDECQLMSDLRHPHLVQFLGVCFLPNSTLPVLVMERLLTSLDELLEHNPDIPLSLKRSILADVARGLVYLHSRCPPVIHRDLSARNVLLNSDMVAKITDLGNTRIVHFKPGQLARTLSRIPGTMVYMPPEAFEATSKYGPGLDCFSFGHLSLFTITQVFPGTLLQYMFRDPKNPGRCLTRTEVQRRDEYIKLLHKQLGEQHPLVLLVKQCLDDEPSERPSAQELLQQLEGMKTQIEDPYQRLAKEKAIRSLREKYSEGPDLHTDEVLGSKLKLAALQTEMKQFLQEKSQLITKDSGLGEETRFEALPSKHEGLLREKHTGDTSSAMASVAVSSAPHSRPKTVKKKVTVVQQATGFQDGTEVVGRYNFHGSAAHDLPFMRGDTLTIICKTKEPNWYKARRSDGFVGMIPYNYVQAIDDALSPSITSSTASSATKTLSNASRATKTSSTASSATHTGPRQSVKVQSMPWFHGDISQESAERLLEPYKNGKFLVQESQNYKGDYSLCVSYGTKVQHYRLRRNDNCWVTVDDMQYFENLVKLVEHYQKDADGLCCRLKHPVVKKSGNIEHTVSLQDFKERGWVIPSDMIQKDISIGKETFRDVWLGKYQGHKVAMRTAKDLNDPKTAPQLLFEAAVMTQLRHPNLVCLIGVTLDKLPIYLITEYMAKGSLLEYLRSQGRAKISKVNQLDFAREVCSGMVYIESRNFVHRNLGARNVLIGDDNKAKVSNFRLTTDEVFSTEELLLPVRWTAPEVLREKKFSNKSDVWSFGILLWEIYSYGRVPYPQVNLVNVLNYLERGYRMDVPDDCPDYMYRIMKECWDKDASIRPNFARIEAMLY